MKTIALNIGEAVSALLTGSDDLKAVVGDKIYPLHAKDDAEYPFVVFSNISTSTGSNKDALIYEELATEAIVICAKTYQQSVDIAKLVTNILQFESRKEVAGLSIRESELTSRSEAFQFTSDGFTQALSFEMHIE